MHNAEEIFILIVKAQAESPFSGAADHCHGVEGCFGRVQTLTYVAADVLDVLGVLEVGSVRGQAVPRGQSIHTSPAIQILQGQREKLCTTVSST